MSRRRIIKRNNKYGIILLAALTIPFLIVAAIIWFTCIE